MQLSQAKKGKSRQSRQLIEDTLCQVFRESHNQGRPTCAIARFCRCKTVFKGIPHVRLHVLFCLWGGEAGRPTCVLTFFLAFVKCIPIRVSCFSRKLRERVLLKNSCSIDHQNDKTIADHQPLTTANDTANDNTIADHQPLTTANDLLRRSAEKMLRRSAEKIC